ncbi:MAG: DAK2 domain-containing protein [Chloroflexi bacterium]|nr:MAG: DAK2 domain-containing protein [Chloroflexota bacterium]RLC85220.1 MAG: DAK2 domain-containing protein [Chloroflexota bacterium]
MATRRSPRLVTDGQGFKRLIKAALGWLQHHQAAINALNVYPVPDGDTGTNMVLTMQSAWVEIKDSPERNVGQIAHKMAHGALMGARGNSGVILSQIWRGFARSLDGKEVYRASDLAAACREAAVTAYKGVVKPVEGTILTVARMVADAATAAAEVSEDLVYVLEHMVFAAHEAVTLTPSLLPVLKEAGVVDAGGQGLFVILEGMLRYMRGEPVAEDVRLVEAVDLITTGLAPGKAGYGYDVQFLIVGQGLDVDTISQRIAEMGECPLVVGDPTMVKVHVHVPDPGVPISYGAGLGSLRDVVVEDMQAQYQDFIAEHELPAPPSPQALQDIGVVAVAPGDGLARVFQSLGASTIVRGGQTMNPSTKDLLEAIENLPVEHVILLPNNSNVILAAEQARALSNKSVAVIPSHSIPQGIAALLAINYQADFETNVAAMTSAMEEIETGEVTTATRSVTINGVEVADGQVIGLHNGELKVTGTTVEEVVRALLKEMNAADHEIITLYYGETISESDANALADLLQQDWPNQEIEVIAGGQPHYYYILSVE